MTGSAPVSAESSEAVTAQALVTPGLWRRMACWMYEGILMFGVVFIAGYLFGTMSQTRNAMDNRNALQAFLFVIFGIYFVWFWAKGQTLAMKTWNIRVVDVQGRAITQSRAIVRYALSWVWLLPALAAAAVFKISGVTLSGAQTGFLTIAWVILWALTSRLNAQKQFWHDVAAGTRLVSSEPMSR